ACKVVEKSIAELEKRLGESEAALEKAKQRLQQRLLTLREAAQTAYNVMNQMRKSGDLKRFAVIQGYVSKDSLNNFKAKVGHRLSFIEEVGHESDAPTLFKNKAFMKAFQNITLAQGPPRFGEVDPTPIIAFIFPIFYGMMFADFGQGLVLFILGLLLYLRGDPSRRPWGTVFAAAGLSATVFGLIVGEAFGFHLSKVSGPLGEFFSQLQILEVAELSQETVLTILTAGILIGVIHITVGLVIDVVNGFREEDRVELWTLKIPSLIMYVAGLFFSLAFISSGFNFGTVLRRVNSAPLPLISAIAPIPSWLMARITFPLVAGAIFVIIFGKAVAHALGKYKEESLFMTIILGLVEFLIRLVEFLANSVSYARLGILLLVHASLMVLAKIAVESGPMGIAAAFAWNIAVMLIEGLIVYIQALRLHIYEWFTKFYGGTGELFQKLIPETRYVEIRWRPSKLRPSAST
ncbi:MAG: V-type ATPase 116kDa subunit family protein, partial [Nitrososphaerota archaeon]